MTAVSQLPGHTPAGGFTDLPGAPSAPPVRQVNARGRDVAAPLTLADEHVLLLWQVTARAGDVMTAAARGRWPGAELASLAGYAEAEVLRQASHEETLLFPACPSPATARLARDHARLRVGAELLTRAAAGEQPFSPGQLATATRDFVDQLEYHMSAEEKLLGLERATRSVPTIAALCGHPHTWYPLTEGPVIDLDALPPGQAVAAAVDRLLRMRRGDQVELQSGADISPVWREIDELSPGGYWFAILEDGPGRWRMRVTRRETAG